MANLFDDRVLFRLLSEDKESNLSLSVFRSTPSLNIFEINSGVKGPSLKMSLGPRISRGVIPYYIKKLKEKPDPTTRYELAFTQYDRETKKSSTLATMIFGRDDKNIPFIGVSSPNLKKPAKYLLRVALNYDVKELTQADQTNIVLDDMVKVFEIDLPMSVILTDENSETKRTRAAAFQNNRNNQQQQQSQEDKVPF